MKLNRTSVLLGIAATASVLGLSACGGGSDFASPSFSAGGTLSGLAASESVQLAITGGATVTLNKNGSYQFTGALPLNASYAVTVAKQPVGQTCSVVNGSGIGITGNLSNINVSCSSIAYSVGGTVSGLAKGAAVALSDNGSDALSITANGAYTFKTPINYSGTYAVTVAKQPTGQVCTVAKGSGAGVTANVGNVDVSCSAITYSVGGSVTGLANGAAIALSDNGSDALSITANGAFTFKAPINYDGAYAVTVTTQPTGQVCTVGKGTGVGVTGKVSNVAVTCQAQTFPVSGTVSGLQTGRQVTLMDNGADPAVVSGNGAFSFASPVSYGSSYAVTVNQQPSGQTCSVSGGTGSGVKAAVSNVVVSCALNGYAIGGTVSGLTNGAQVTLFDNGGDALVVKANGAFTFATPVVPGGSYAVSVNQQAAGELCTVSAGSGTASARVSNVVVTCAVAYTVGGTVSGLPGGTHVTLSNNGADSVTVSANGAYAFPTRLLSSAAYSVKVTTQPSGATCVVNNNSGSVSSSNVSNVAVACTTSADVLPLLQFAQGQMADSQWDVSACTTTTTCNIFSDNPGTTYLTPFTNGLYDWSACGAGARMVFDENIVGGVQDATNPYIENLYRADGTLCQAGASGHFVAAGRDAQNNVYLFYVGNDNNTGTLVSPQAQLTGAGLSFTGTQNPTYTQITQYLSGP